MFSLSVFVKSLKDKKGKTVLNAFIEIINAFNRKPNELWVDQGRKFYNNFMQEWLGHNDFLIMYSTQNEDKSVIAKRFIKTKGKICKKKWQLMIAYLIFII